MKTGYRTQWQANPCGAISLQPLLPFASTGYGLTIPLPKQVTFNRYTKNGVTMVVTSVADSGSSKASVAALALMARPLMFVMVIPA